MDDRERRLGMVDRQIASRGVRDPRVLEAMREVPRHLFVPADLQSRAYEDRALPIADSQTISQPYIVAVMTELEDKHGVVFDDAKLASAPKLAELLASPEYKEWRAGRKR